MPRFLPLHARYSCKDALISSQYLSDLFLCSPLPKNKADSIYHFAIYAFFTKHKMNRVFLGYPYPGVYDPLFIPRPYIDLANVTKLTTP